MIIQWKIKIMYKNQNIGIIILSNWILQCYNLSSLLFIITLDLLSVQLNNKIAKLIINWKEYPKSHSIYW